MGVTTSGVCIIVLVTQFVYAQQVICFVAHRRICVHVTIKVFCILPIGCQTPSASCFQDLCCQRCWLDLASGGSSRVLDLSFYESSVVPSYYGTRGWEIVTLHYWLVQWKCRKSQPAVALTLQYLTLCVQHSTRAVLTAHRVCVLWNSRRALWNQLW